MIGTTLATVRLSPKTENIQPVRALNIQDLRYSPSAIRSVPSVLHDLPVRTW